MVVVDSIIVPAFTFAAFTIVCIFGGNSGKIGRTEWYKTIVADSAFPGMFLWPFVYGIVWTILTVTNIISMTLYWDAISAIQTIDAWCCILWGVALLAAFLWQIFWNQKSGFGLIMSGVFIVLSAASSVTLFGLWILEEHTASFILQIPMFAWLVYATILHIKFTWTFFMDMEKYSGLKKLESQMFNIVTSMANTIGQRSNTTTINNKNSNQEDINLNLSPIVFNKHTGKPHYNANNKKHNS